jgi:hypothetical protein
MNLVSAWIAAHPERYRGWFEPNLAYTLLTHRALLGAAFLVAPPFTALKLARSVELVSLALGALALARRLGSAATVVVPLCVAAAFGWFHLMGYLNFAFAVALVPWALACVRDGASRRDLVLMALAFLVIIETHAFVGAGLASIVLAAAFFHHVVDRPADAVPLRGVALAAAPAFVLVGVAMLVATPSDFETRSRRVTTLAQDLAALPQNVFGGYSPLGGPLAALAVVTAVVWLWSERRERTLRWWVGILALASLAAYFVAPLDALGWLFLKPRFLPFPFLVAAMPARLPVRWARVLGPVAIVLASAHVAIFGVRSARAGRRVADTVASFGAEPPGVALPIVFDGHDGEEPAGNLGALTYAYAYALLNGGGAAPLLFAHNPAIHHILYAEGVAPRVPERPNVWAYRWLSRTELADAAALASCTADSVLVIGASPEDRAGLEERGIRFTAPGRGRPSCARGQLRIVRGSAPVRVRIGVAATKSWVFDALLEEPMGVLDMALPAGAIDVVVSTPAGRTLVERQLTLEAGGTFKETIAAP